MTRWNIKQFVKIAASRGQSLVELAISLMVILMLLLGAIETSMALFQYVTIRDAAQEAVNFASFNPTDTAEIQLHARAAASDVLVLENGHIAVTTTPSDKACEGTTNGSPHSITVTITYPHKIIFPLVGPMLGTNTITLRTMVTNAILWPNCLAP
ncbi:MAG: pilus assembly protein [Chloroflexi bacterium]|nr:pilus assembly protein [Chloroflexota bacterium]